MKYLLIVVLALLTTLISFFVGRLSVGYKPKQFVLEKPLVISTKFENMKFQLPPDTTLVLDENTSEGGYARYKVYINVFGPDLPLASADRAWEVSPLTAYLDDE